MLPRNMPSDDKCHVRFVYRIDIWDFRWCVHIGALLQVMYITIDNITSSLRYEFDKMNSMDSYNRESVYILYFIAPSHHRLFD